MSKVDESRAKPKVGAQKHRQAHHHLSFPSQEERIRQIFGLPPGTPLPPVSQQSLEQYYAYLSGRLSLPLEAMYCQHGGEMRQLIQYVRVLELSDPKEIRQSTLHGLYCKVESTKQALHVPLTELGIREENPNCQMLDDYSYWFVNWR
jgi:hypothetical protein